MKYSIERIELIEREMVMMWADGDEVVHQLKTDKEFVQVVTEAIFMDKGYWSQFMVVGEA
tara:strand:+ start:346 stop:525 length:180 start_codon:yes stop_codon:yes gene_type:complete